jgi:endonuclease-8
MPEGDTILRAARTLQKVLAGKAIVAAESPRFALADSRLVGRTVAKVEALGKNLLIRFDDGRVLHTHMRMTGSWHVYRPGERWQKPRRDARIVLATDDFVTVCFNAPVVRLLAAAEVERDPALTRLGPDLLSPGFSRAEALRRIGALAPIEIGEAVMRQDAVAGIGNVYKSETLFVCRVDPFARVGALPEETLGTILDAARRLMSANLTGRGPRTTRPSLGRERTWVYGRRGRPCRKCRTPIRMRRQGADLRSTYWCPACQAPIVPSPPDGGRGSG